MRKTSAVQRRIPDQSVPSSVRKAELAVWWKNN
jgi:hypothetical protein